ncbi:protein C Serine peptidase. MEROPS family S49 [Azotobacter beijerinckii]|uniref:Protein C Serine peptidase. MEROPS family S49 n=1 Tax=Azotobacter beijerinckii TaxID=170623 RepID=A0A1H6UI85_9GAMM|nr:S49 family peptidase [Azotobacter beijerinckii]SEI90454.1 protein C Serine peptidase. MEROPS family S49 [Azotobacter beijerinckii]
MLKPNLLSRLFSRGQGGPLVPQIYSRVVNRPLLVEPAMADALIDGWMRGGVEAGAGGEPRQILERVGNVAVLDVSGPLIARAVEPVCGVAPTSYEGLMLAFDEIEADANITHVVLRLETPGGEAAQVFDLTDRMAELRNSKTLIAMVDDYAYSGGYAIAAACSEIWITRTGGVGSIGVVIGHREVSEANAKAGIKWTYVHSGAMKVAGNPNEPLSDEARGFMQGESDRLYDLFVGSVAQYRGLSVEAVRATEAGILFGQNAIDAGLADHLGTFRELMTELQGGAYTRKVPLREESMPLEEEELPDDIEMPEAPEEGDSAALAGMHDQSGQLSAEAGALDPVVLAERCATHGLAALTATALKERWSTSQLEAAVERAQEIRNLCTAAGMAQLAADYITAGAGVEVVRSELASRLQQGPYLSNRQSAVGTHSTADAWRRTMKKIGA